MRDLSKQVSIVTNAVSFSVTQCRLKKGIIHLATKEKWKKSKNKQLRFLLRKERIPLDLASSAGALAPRTCLKQDKWYSLVMMIVSGFEPLAYRLGALPKTLKHRKDGLFRVVRSWFNHSLATSEFNSYSCIICNSILEICFKLIKEIVS